MLKVQHNVVARLSHIFYLLALFVEHNALEIKQFDKVMRLQWCGSALIVS